MSRSSILAAILLAALLASYGLTALEDRRPPTHTPVALGLPAAWVLEDVRVRTWEGSRETIVAHAARIEVRTKRAGIFTLPALRETRVSGLDARVTKAGGATTRLRADRALLDPLRPFWLLEGNARVEEAGRTLACAKVRWDPVTGPLPSSRCRPIAPAASIP